MNSTISVSKGQDKILLETERLENSDIIIRKTTKGKEYEITLRRFSDDEIDELYQAIDSIYEKMKTSKMSFREKLERFLKDTGANK